MRWSRDALAMPRTDAPAARMPDGAPAAAVGSSPMRGAVR